MPGLRLVCNTARMGNCDFGGGFTTRPKDHLDSYSTDRHTRAKCVTSLKFCMQPPRNTPVDCGLARQGRVSRAAKPPHLPTPHGLYTSPIGRCPRPHASYLHTQRGPSKDRLSANRSQPISPSYSLPPGLLPEPRNTLYRYWRLLLMTLDALANGDAGAVA